MSGWGSWASGLVASSLDGLKKVVGEEVLADVREFTETIRADTAAAVVEGRARLEERPAAAPVIIADRREAARARLQADPATYGPPAEPAYAAWAAGFNLAAQIDEISGILAANEAARLLHSRLVPADLAYKDFWLRYFWRLHLFEEQESKRNAVLQQATEEEDFSWGDDDEAEHDEVLEEIKAKYEQDRAAETAPPEPTPTPEVKPAEPKEQSSLQPAVAAVTTEQPISSAPAADEDPFEWG